MAYVFNPNVPDSSITTSELTTRTDRWDNSTADQIDDSFWKDNVFMEQQLMSSDSLNGLLSALNRGDASTRLVLNMAIGDQLRFRPWIGLENGSNVWRFELEAGTPDIPDNGPRAPITPGSASAFVANFDSTDKSNLCSLFEYTDPNSVVHRVKTYTYSATDTSDLLNKALASEYGKVHLYLFFGSGSEQAGDEGVSHPMDFRPVLDLKVTKNDGAVDSTFWDFSTPCPPNCAGRN